MTNKNAIAETTQKVLHPRYQPGDGALRAMSRYAVTVECRESGFRNRSISCAQGSLNGIFGEGNYSLEVVGENGGERTIDFDLLIETGKLIELAYVGDEKGFQRNACEEAVRGIFKDRTHESVPIDLSTKDWKPVKVEYKGTGVFSVVEEQHTEKQ